MHEYIPENNLMVMFLLIIITMGTYYFWWLARTSRVFGDDPVMNILLTIFTFGVWSLYLNLKYMQKSEMMNGRDMKWFMILFLPISPIIIQHNVNEKLFPGR
ncbi:MAG TPA: hypothetical protein P5120_16175 [Spirochaetota bacterium]|nr:hypothetical protein [Spirochaetota bacterium]HPF08080.1 hypothetical protein [Spirochaetota bacterium]HPJ44294.1 hypothetical protein [Spirochaetota bacterium]HPR39352.1 hypothetical protein [Spirochaetota bacterium]HRX49057.1 hypothetical protein [Spirochaetota bacterium]